MQTKTFQITTDLPYRGKHSLLLYKISQLSPGDSIQIYWPSSKGKPYSNIRISMRNWGLDIPIHIKAIKKNKKSHRGTYRIWRQKEISNSN